MRGNQIRAASLSVVSVVTWLALPSAGLAQPAPDQAVRGTGCAPLQGAGVTSALRNQVRLAALRDGVSQLRPVDPATGQVVTLEVPTEVIASLVSLQFIQQVDTIKEERRKGDWCLTVTAVVRLLPSLLQRYGRAAEPISDPPSGPKVPSVAPGARVATPARRMAEPLSVSAPQADPIGTSRVGTGSEMYVAADIGAALANSFENSSGVAIAPSGTEGFTLNGLSMQPSLLYGVKVGMMQRGGWWGVETEVWHTTPNIKQQTIALSGGGSETQPGNRVSLTTWALNAIVRYPGERFQPYLGAGLGVFFASVKDFVDTVGASDTNVGFNALIGLRYFLTERLAVFGEWKYAQADLTFAGVGPTSGFLQEHGTYRANMAVAGVSVHF